MNITDYFSQQKDQKFKKGEIIIRGDDSPSGVYLLEKGFVKMSSIFSDGTELSINIFKPGSFFPMIWAIGGFDNTYYFQALTPVEVKKVSKAEFDEYISKNPDVLMDLTKRILIALDGVVTNFKYIIKGDSCAKVASVFTVFVKRFGEKNKKGKIIITIPLSHQTIASFAGITRETTSLAIEKLRKENVISKEGKYLAVKSLESLEKYFQ